MEAWRVLISETFADFRPDVPRPERFSAAIRTFQLSDLRVSDITAGEQTVRRGAAEIRASPAGRLFFVYQVEGASRVEHDRGTVNMDVGDCVLFDPDQPYQLGFDSRFRHVCVQIPEWRLRERAGGTLSGALGQVLTTSPAIAHVLRAATESLLFEDDAEAPAPDRAEIFLDVLARSLARLDRQGAGADASLASRAGRERLREFIAREFRDEHLAPSRAAAALGCSVRNVHKLSSGSGDSFGRMVMAARLSAARLALAQSGSTRISDVAYDCGFSDLSHFSRSFKSRFGVSPRRYRDGWR